EAAAWIAVAGELEQEEIQLLAATVAQAAQQAGAGCRQVVLDLSGVSSCSHNSAFILLGMCYGMEIMGITVTMTELSSAAHLAFKEAELERWIPFHQHDGRAANG
ncbi:hypothetical protein, partial [Streptomyces minutiscleroticus]|uniref:hypothetical protein n=1 Tax=Streptomyces minutiscleroticus TaxID=68238 RepID=UPI00167E1A9E